jgi:hypothetical protein
VRQSQLHAIPRETIGSAPNRSIAKSTASPAMFAASTRRKRHCSQAVKSSLRCCQSGQRWFAASLHPVIVQALGQQMLARALSTEH